jgi:DNA-binding GntR family transcriptional regulator
MTVTVSKHSVAVDPTPARDGEKVLQALRESILRLDLRPGAVIDEANLAAQMSVSRTPIREAIIQLISDGLVVRDGRSARVAPLDFDEVPKLYDALLISSRMIHRLAAENRSEADLKAIRTALKGFEALVYIGDGVQRQDANLLFHTQIAKAAGNKYFIEFYERTLIASSRLSRACFSNRNLTSLAEAEPDDELVAHVTETARQHVLMVEAIEARDVEASDLLAIEHQKLSFDRLQKTMFTGSRSIASTPKLKMPERMFAAGT